MANARSKYLQRWAIDQTQHFQTDPRADVAVGSLAVVDRRSLHVLELHKRIGGTTSGGSVVINHSSDPVIARPHAIQHCPDFLDGCVGDGSAEGERSANELKLFLSSHLGL